MQENTKFKARLGFDSNEETIINVGNPKDSLDAVNLSHFNYHNSITTYDTKRGYDKNFITNYNNQLYYALENIASPAGEFNGDKWKAVSASPVWEKILPELTPKYQMKSGSHLVVTTESGDLELTLPQNPLEGETINILDIGANVGYNSLTIKSRINNIKDPKNTRDGVIQNVNSLLLTIPRALYTFVYVTGFWELHSDLNEKFLYIPLGTEDKVYKAQSGIHLTNQSGNSDVTLYLPDYALNGDIVSYEATGQSNTFVTVKFTDENPSTTVNSNHREFKFPTYAHLRFVYDVSGKTWISSYSNKLRKKTIVTGNTYSPLINEDVTVLNYPDKDTTITINMPQNAIENDTFELYTNQTNAFVSVDVVSDVDISYLPSSFGTQRFADHNIGDNHVKVKKLTFNPLELRISSVTFIRKGLEWLIAKTDDFNFLACPTNPEIAGIMELVPPSEMLADVMTRGNCAVTPRLLETRTPTELRKGIIEIATQAETNAGTDDVRAVTPKKLVGMKATTGQVGVISLATQTEVDNGTNNTKAVTPLTLNKKLPNDTGKLGVISLVSNTVAVEGVSRTSVGTGIYNYNDGALVVTPKSLNLLVSTVNSAGLSFMATDTEVLAGTATTVPTYVTPSALHKRTATETRTGLAEIATQAETNAGTDDLRFITPKKFMACISTTTQKGVSLLATQAQVDTGTTNNIVTPSTLHKKIATDDGKIGLVGLVSNTVAVGGSTRATAGTGVYDFNDGELVITPKSLHLLKSNEQNFGLSVEATLSEVLAGTLVAGTPTFVTPNKLHQRTATASRTGLAKLTTTTNVKDATNKTDIVTPETLNSLVGTTTQKGLMRFATTADLNAKNTDSAVTPSELAKRLEGKTVSSSTKEITITGNLWDGVTLNMSNQFQRPIYFSKKDNKLEDGYFFYIFKEGSSDLTSALTWLNPPPTNKEGYDVITNGKATQVVPSGKAKEYKADYLYESHTSGNSVFEKLTVKDVSYQRFSTVNGSTVTNNGWTMIYNSLNKPIPKEINAIDKDDIIVGQVQVADFLDIIVDAKNRLRIKPNLDSDEKVSYLWLQSEKGVFNE